MYWILLYIVDLYLQNETFVDLYLQNDFESEDDSISTSSILAAIRRSCCAKLLLPVLCGASLRGKGVESLLDSIAAFLPSPMDRPDIRLVGRDSKEKIQLLNPQSAELCGMCFKVVHDPQRGPLVYVRIYSGQLTAKQTLTNSTRQQRERINQLLKVSADDLDMIASSGAGTVCCLVGLKHTVTGDTLLATNSSLAMDGLTIPRPVFSLSIEPEKASQQKELEKALSILCVEDPSLQVEISSESGQTLLRGIGELHLEIVCEKLRRQHGIDITCGRSYVAFRESIDSSVLPFSKIHSYDKVPESLSYNHEESFILPF